MEQGGAGAEPVKALFYSTSRDARAFAAREPLPTQGTPRHAQLAIDDAGRPVIVWEEAESGARRIVVARGEPDGEGGVRFTREPIGSGVYPAVAATDDGVVVAWTSGPPSASVIQIERGVGSHFQKLPPAVRR